MLQWMAVSWLWALGAMVVPVAIHWLSKRHAKEVPVGTLRFFEEEESKHFQSFRLQDKWRLFLRLLFTASLVLALAQPVWLYKVDAQKQAPWVLVSNDVLPGGYYNYAELHHLLDSLRQGQAVEVRRLAYGFPPLKQPLRNETDAWGFDYTLFLPLLDSLATQRPVYVVAGLERSRWGVILPAVNKNKVDWHFLLPDYSDTLFRIGSNIYARKTAYPVLSFQANVIEKQPVRLSWVVAYDASTAPDTTQWRRFFEEAFREYIVDISFCTVEECKPQQRVDVWWSLQAPGMACYPLVRKQKAAFRGWCLTSQAEGWTLVCLPGDLPGDEYELLKHELWREALRRQDHVPETLITPPAFLRIVKGNEHQANLAVNLTPWFLWLSIALCIIDLCWFIYEQRGTD